MSAFGNSHRTGTMADDWEDWEADDYQPNLPAVKKPEVDTVGQALLAATLEPDSSKFAGEDEEEDEPAPKPVKTEAPKPKAKPQQPVRQIDIPLDDPVAEKLRQQRLIEEADYQAAKELFGGDDRRLEDLLPISLKDFEDYAALMVNKYVLNQSTSKHYKGFAKAILKAVVGPMLSTEVKDLETCLAGLRAEKLKAEQAEKAKKGGKKTVNVGRAGGTAGLDDYIYDEALDDDDGDFM